MKENRYVTVWKRSAGNIEAPLFVAAEVAARFGVTKDQEVSGELLGKLLVASCEYFIALCDLNIAIDDFKEPVL